MDAAECIDLNNKRERILNAAINAFSSQGFYRTRITDIARAAKVADGTVYLYFESKEQLLAAIFNESMKSFAANDEKDAREMEDPKERLLHVLRIHLQNIGRDRQLATVFQVEMRHSAHFMKETSRAELRDYLKGIQEIIEEGKERGMYRADLDSWFAAKSIFALLDEAATNWVLSENDYALEDEADRIMEFITKGMK